jgi:hypothetical protein
MPYKLSNSFFYGPGYSSYGPTNSAASPENLTNDPIPSPSATAYLLMALHHVRKTETWLPKHVMHNIYLKLCSPLAGGGGRGAAAVFIWLILNLWRYASLIFCSFFLILKLSNSSSRCKNNILNLFMFNNGTYTCILCLLASSTCLKCKTRQE